MMMAVVVAVQKEVMKFSLSLSHKNICRHTHSHLKLQDVEHKNRIIAPVDDYRAINVHLSLSSSFAQAFMMGEIAL
jgi:hypothetical protein